MHIPEDNPLTEEGVFLGRKLFYEPLLSANNKISCASCHQHQNYFKDSNFALSTGVDGFRGERNAMTLFNVGYEKKFFWDGGANDLESQALGPITNPLEMHETMLNVVNKLQSNPEYPSLFKKAFGTDKISTKFILYALAQFERTLLSGNTRFDKWQRGEITLTSKEMNGFNIFLDEQKGTCAHCHTLGNTFTDFEFRDIGLDSIPLDLGRYRITLNPDDIGKFKTSTLRNIAMTAPYMHDGRFATLRECIEFYNTGFHYSKNLAPELKNIPKGRLSDDDIDDLIVFLNTLTDTSFIHNKNFSNPK
ncbi:MAG: cytochrome C peroxidase [Bacteroidetes bacterium OLB11]|nr:MAG: cytochrome C peroxidase [Bacteroidetes bacterium OLB11]